MLPRSSQREDTAELEEVQKRATGMIKGLEQLFCEESLKSLELFRLEKKATGVCVCETESHIHCDAQAEYWSAYSIWSTYSICSGKYTSGVSGGHGKRSTQSAW